VRALVRDSARADGLGGAEIVEGSFEDTAAIDRAMDGVDAMLLAGRDGPAAVAQHLRVLDRAEHAGVRHVVRLSAIGASPGSPIALMRDHAEVDAVLRAGRFGWTLLRPHLYLQNLLRAADAVRRDGVLIAPMGNGRHPFVDTRDVGAAAAVVLADPARHAGATYALTGPRAVGYAEVAAALARVAGRPVEYVAAVPEEHEARLRTAGMPGWRAFDLAHIARAYEPADEEVSPDAAALLGRPPRSLERFLADHAEVFRAS
jgi:uncharacterized protein YbjT (DUF2867 family)